jgi:transposase-like protein
MNTKLPPKVEDVDFALPKLFKRFPDEASAVEYFESIRWPNGPVCAHCGNAAQNRIYKLKPNPKAKIRVGLYQCADCDRQFRVTVGTIFEDSHIPLNTWIIAWYLMCGSKKGMSALQLKRHLWGDGKGSYKTAWFMAHRIRHAMSDPIFEGKLSGDVEIDETYVGGKVVGRGKGYCGNKTAVYSLVERGGTKRSFVSDTVTARNVREAIGEHVNETARIHTDGSPIYKKVGETHEHHAVDHKAKEYARKMAGFTTHTNTVESSFSLLKRGIMGSFHHVSKKHLPKYMGEFDFRWNHRTITDSERTVAALKKADGKRLTYQPLTKAA